MRTKKSTLTLLGWLCFLLSSLVSAAPRLALVIGNSAYSNAPLTNPVNDARDMAVKLRSLGFEVAHKQNITRKQMRDSVRQFSKKLRKLGGTGLFFYAGHGLQVNGQNYLVPVKADIREEFDVPDQSLSANYVPNAMESADNYMNIVIIDACRDNPFARGWRSSVRGLARMDPPNGSIIAYATGPGKTAADGDGRNGTYTHHLLKNMDKPGLTLEQVFKRTRQGVEKDTSGKQTPWEESSLRGDFYFLKNININVEKPTDQTTGQYTNNADAEITFWNSIKDKQNPAYLNAYIKKFPQGIYIELAKIALSDNAALEQRKTILTIQTSPKNAQVRILNIKPKYRSGMDLPYGRYLIEVTQPTYQRHTEWIILQNENHVHRVNLIEDASVISAVKKPMTTPGLQENKEIIYGILKLKTSPANAQVSMLGNEYDYQYGMQLPTRTYRLQISANGFHHQTINVDIKQGINHIEVELKPGMGVPEMIRIASGSFVMGSNHGDSDEQPSHKVNVQAFEIGRFEVTFVEYDTFAQETGRTKPDDMGWGRNKRPVVNISWRNAVYYTEWLSQKTGKHFRLPTEQEWEYVAQAGRQTRFYFGNNYSQLCQFANGADLSTDFTWRNRGCNDGYRKQTSPVGKFEANLFGVYDMYGNVWEWVADCWTENYSYPSPDIRNCQKVLRGGAWDSAPTSLRGTNRSKNSMTSKHHNFGFRIARSIN